MAWSPPSRDLGVSHRARGSAAGAVPDWIRELVRLLDGAFRIPGTEIYIGLDPILGFFLPGAGDVLTAIPSMLLVAFAVRQRVPRVIVLRMLLNVATDALVGAVPFLGDLFDVAFRSNSRNLELLERYAGTLERPRAGDYLIVAAAVLAVGALALLPLLLIAALIKLLFAA